MKFSSQATKQQKQVCVCDEQVDETPYMFAQAICGEDERTGRRKSQLCFAWSCKLKTQPWHYLGEEEEDGKEEEPFLLPVPVAHWKKNFSSLFILQNF